MIKSNAGEDNKYVVFDFDNTCSIFDVEEQLAVYQLQVMAFDESVTVDKLKDILATDLNPEYFSKPAPASADYCANPDATYKDWIDDIAEAYKNLLAKGYKFTPAGLSPEEQVKIQEDDDWKEFATKMRAMYDCVFDSESADVAYPWVLYWFTGMTHKEVYDLATASHTFYKDEVSRYETWTTAGTGSKIGSVEYEFTWGTAVSQNINDLMQALAENGIDVWVCSASATDPIRAAIDVWGLHDYVTGMMAMTNVYRGGVFLNEYDYETGMACIPVPSNSTEDGWTYGTVPTKAQTQGKGKVTAIQNVCGSEYGCGPIAGFMDSTGDYNFCTEFEDLQVVCCFNRASRKVTDGGGVIAETAVYEADTLGYNYYSARVLGDTLYVLQGREENGLRGLRPERATMRLDKTETILFRNEDNYTQLQYMIDNDMKVADIIDQFAIKRAVGEPGNPFDFKIGFLKEYSGYHSQGASDMGLLKNKDWNPEVKRALNDMIKANANSGQYAVFDFDNTCSIFDVEEQLAIYQLQVMAFDETVDAVKLEDILKTELNPKYFTEPAPASKDYCANANATYQDWIDDITAAFAKLDETYDFTPAGLTPDQQAAIQKTDEWKEFATKMRAMYDCVFDSESAAVAYPWVLYWFTGMTEDEVYELATASHTFYKDEVSRYETWTTAGTGSKIGAVEYEFTWGTQVSDNIVELWKALAENGIDVWICSASATDPIRAAIDVWGGHEYIIGMMAMTNKLDADGHYINEYDWDGGYAWIPVVGTENRGWIKDDVKQKTQTQGKGKVLAIQNVLYPKYNNHGPIAGFMDSTGDYNFCTEFDTLQVVCCFNRASRKVTDGGGVIAELAVYQADVLDYDYDMAQFFGDTLYVLQGREENGLRGLRPERPTMRLDKTETILFRNEDNYAQLAKMIELDMDTKTIVDDFAIKTDADDPKYGFSFKYGFVYGQPGEGLGPKFVDPTYNPDALDFSGYHSQA
jgi:phosphoserine phosphatase